MTHQPRILAFLCNWCSYSAADAAGMARISHPQNVRVVRVMCTGRVDPAFVTAALAKGADGVLICGCHAGDCHYIDGNKKAMGRMHLLRRVLDDLGVDSRRVRLEWVSAQQSERYAALITEMTEELSALGPLDWPGVARI